MEISILGGLAAWVVVCMSILATTIMFLLLIAEKQKSKRTIKNELEIRNRVAEIDDALADGEPHERNEIPVRMLRVGFLASKHTLRWVLGEIDDAGNEIEKP